MSDLLNGQIKINTHQNINIQKEDDKEIQTT